MKWIPSYTEDALGDLEELGKRAADRITTKVSEYCQAEKPLSFAKKLQGSYSDCYRFRVGEYRVIFKYLPDGDVQILLVVRAALRRDLY